MLEIIAFYLFSGLLLLSALLAVTLRHPVYCVLSFLVSMFSLALLFVLQKAYFVAIIHITVYAGAILVLFLFILMLLGYDKEPPSLWTHPVRWGLAAGVATLALAGLVVAYWFVGAGSPRPGAETAPLPGTIDAVGRLLFTTYLLPFELLSLVLLVAIIGSVVLAKREL